MHVAQAVTIRAYCATRVWANLTFHAGERISAFTDRTNQRPAFPAMFDSTERDALKSRKATANVGEYHVVGRVITLTFIRRSLLGHGRLPTTIMASNL